MYLGLDIDIGSLPPLFEGELPDINSDDPVNITLPKLQQQTDSASTPAFKLLSDYTIAEVENNSNRIDESVLKADFYNKYHDHCNRTFSSSNTGNSKDSRKKANSQILTLDKICQGVHHQNCEELSKQSLENVLECQGRADEDFIKEKVSDIDIDIDIGSLLFEGELLDTNNGDPVNIALPKLQRETDSASTPAFNLLSDYTTAQVENNSKYHDHCNRTFSSSNTSNSKDSRKKVNSQILSRIDKNVLKTDFYNTLDKKCQEVHHQNFEELSKQSLKNALEFQGRVYQDFTKEKAKLSKKQLVSTDRFEYPCIVTNCVFTHINRIDVKTHLFKHLKVSQYYCEQCLPYTFFARNTANLNRHIRRKHSTDSTLSKYGAKLICPPDQNTMNFFSECNVSQVSDQQQTDSASTPASNLLSNHIIAQVKNNSKGSKKKANIQILNRIDEKVLKTDFYNALDKKCQEVHHQNFEELSKQSLKNALELQGKVYQDFTKEKAKLSKKQLVFPDRFEYPCIVTNCAFTRINRIDVETHLFKHLKVSQYYCEQCLPYTFFARDTAKLNRHIRRKHSTDSTLFKYGAKRICPPDQNTMNSFRECNVSQVSDQQQIDSASTPAFNWLSDYVIAQVKNNSKGSRKKANSQILNRIDENVLKTDFYNTLDKKCQEEHHQDFEELSKQSLKNALEFQGRVYQDFTKKKVELSEKQLVSPDRYEYPCIVTNCPFTHINRMDVKTHLFKHIKVSRHYCEQCLPCTFFARDTTNLNRHIRSMHSTDSTLFNYGAKRICPPDQSTMNFFSECNVSQVSDQQQTDSASTPVYNLLFDYTIAQLENNSNHIDESVLKADFYNKYQDHGNRIFYSSTPSNSEGSANSQILKYGAKRICPPDQSTMNFFSECNVSVTAQNLVGNFTETPRQPSKISTDFPENAFLPPNFEQLHVSQVSDQQQTDSASTPVSNLLFDYTVAQLENNSNRIDKSVLKTDFYNTYQNHGNRIFYSSNPSNSEGSANSQILKYGAKGICPPDQNTMNFFSECNVSQVSDQQQTDNASTLASKLLSDYTTAEVKNNSNRIDESVLKTDFYNTLDKVCQKVHHQNFEELSKQSLKNALEFQGRVYEVFTKEKVKLSEKQLVSTDRYEYPCIVTNCSFTRISRAGLQVHLFKHTKVSQYYCEHCLPYTLFVRDKTALNRHIKCNHSTDSTPSKYGVKRICPPDQNTMNFFSECNVSQVSDPCSLLNSAKRAKTDP